MKFIKLISDNISQAVWKNALYEPLTIKPGSEVALKNLSIQFNDPKYTVDDTNNIFKIKTKADALEKTITLSIGEYTLSELVQEIELKLNNSLSSLSSSSDSYLQFKVGTLTNLKNETNIVISFSRSVQKDITAGDCQSENITFGNPLVYKTNTTNDGTYNARLVCTTLVSNGGGDIQITVNNQDTSDIQLSNWIFGVGELISYDLTLKDEIIASLFACFANSNGNYAYKKNNAMIQSSVSITANDKLYIYKTNGKIRYIISRNGSNVLSVDGDVINDSFPLYGVKDLTYNLFIGNDTGKIAFSELTEVPNPFVVNNNNQFSILQASEVPDVYIDSNINAPTATKISIIFPSTGIQRLLGYSSPLLERIAKSWRFVGDLGLDVNLFNNDLEVEIDELPLYNYSSSTNQIRPLVMTIPSSELKNNIVNQGGSFFELSYSESATFLFLDLELKQNISLPALTVRILTDKGNIVPMNGKATITLLIKEPKNKMD